MSSISQFVLCVCVSQCYVYVHINTPVTVSNQLHDNILIRCAYGIYQLTWPVKFGNNLGSDLVMPTLIMTLQ